MTPVKKGVSRKTAARMRLPSTTTTALGWGLHPALAAGGAAFCVGAAGPLVASLRLLQPSQQLLRPEPAPGAVSHALPDTLGDG